MSFEQFLQCISLFVAGPSHLFFQLFMSWFSWT